MLKGFLVKHLAVDVLSWLHFHAGTGGRRPHDRVIGPLRVHTLVQIHHYCVHGAELIIKHALHVAMGTWNRTAARRSVSNTSKRGKAIVMRGKQISWKIDC